MSKCNKTASMTQSAFQASATSDGVHAFKQKNAILKCIYSFLSPKAANSVSKAKNTIWHLTINASH
ncbi:MAG TPA: hypothetical protein DCS35_02285 [Vibrio sp.]|nr:hypothetical protein [Vibrio sp.]